MRCVLVGNYGVGNIGDEALKEYFLGTFPDVEWTVISAHPRASNEVPRLPLGLRSLFAPWWKTIAAIRRADALVFGGGSLFTDIESVWACLIWRSYASVATLFGTPYCMAFQGVGPWKTTLGRKLTLKTYRHAAFISVRDEKSLARAVELRPGREPVLSFDPAYAHFSAYPSSQPPSGRVLAVIPRLNSDEAFFSRVAALAQDKWDRVTILLMEPEADRAAAGKLKLLLPAAQTVDIRSVRQLLDEVSAASFVVCQRFHGALAALALGRAFDVVPQGAGDKMATLKEAAADPVRRAAWLELVRTGAEALRNAL